MKFCLLYSMHCLIVCHAINSPVNPSAEMFNASIFVETPLTTAQLPPGRTAASAAWALFWKTFTNAIGHRDSKMVAALTAADFFDGGGSTVQQWLETDVFATKQTFASMQQVLSNGAVFYKGYNKAPYKATGNNKSGDLFFVYAGNKWLFGGIVGD